jgi:DNA-binding FadR family transcriptional regulator
MSSAPMTDGGPQGLPLVEHPQEARVMAAPRFVPVTRRRAFEAVVQQIEDAMLSGALQPGDRLPSERELCAQLGVSRPTLREAMRSLESGGLVELRPNDPTGGAVVRRPDGSGFERSLLSLARFSQISLADLIGFRMLLETTACYLAARADDPGLLESIVAAHEAVADVIEGSDAAFVAADIDFHVAVARASGNRMLELCTNAVKSAMAVLIGDAITKSQGEARRDFVRRHGAIVEAIRAGSAERASACARQDIVECYVPLLTVEEAQHVDALRAFMTP